MHVDQPVVAHRVVTPHLFKEALSTHHFSLVVGQVLEKAELAARTLPGYRRISMDVLLFKRGAADWEYTYRPNSDTTLHERRLLAAVTDGRSYLLRWTTADRDWTSALIEQRQQMNLFTSAD